MDLPIILDGTASQVQCCTLSGDSPRALSRFLLKSGSVLLSRAFGHGFFASPGNSHSRGFQPLLAVPDAPPACFLRGTHIVAAYSRSLWFPTLRLPVSATGGGRLRSRWRRQAPVPQGAAMASPSQVQCCTLAADGPSAQSLFDSKRKTPHICGVFSFWNPAVSYSPGSSPTKYHRR